jgi:hypothetical protein
MCHRRAEAGLIATQAIVDAFLHVFAHLHFSPLLVFAVRPYCTFRTSIRPPPAFRSTLLLAV